MVRKPRLVLMEFRACYGETKVLLPGCGSSMAGWFFRCWRARLPIRHGVGGFTIKLIHSSTHTRTHAPRPRATLRSQHEPTVTSGSLTTRPPPLLLDRRSGEREMHLARRMRFCRLAAARPTLVPRRCCCDSIGGASERQLPSTAAWSLMVWSVLPLNFAVVRAVRVLFRNGLRPL